jgi:hypothetical protein
MTANELMVGSVNCVVFAHERLALVPPPARDHLEERFLKCHEGRLGLVVHFRVIGIQRKRNR